MPNETKTPGSADCQGSVNSNDQANNSINAGLTQWECMERIIAAHKKGQITTEQANSLIKRKCPGFYNWRIK